MSQDTSGKRQGTLAALSLSMLLSALGTSSANVALPTLAHAFGAPFQQVQWVVLAYLLAITSLVVSAGRLGDLMGRRRLLVAGIASFAGASLLCGLAPTLWLLIGARALQGVGAAVMMALTMAFVGAAVPKEKTGGAMGLLGAMSAVGTALGPSLGGLLIAGFGWRSIFLLNLPLGIVAFALAYRCLPADAPRPASARPGFDHRGTLLLALALAAFTMAMTIGRGKFGVLNGALLLTAGAAGALFVMVEKTSASPLIRLEMFRERRLSAAFVMSALVTTVVMATLVVGPFYLSGALALSTAGVGMVMSAGPVVAALTGVPASQVVDRFGAHRITLAGLTAMGTGCATMAMAPLRFGVAGYAIPLVMLTAGYALFQAANNTAVMTTVQTDQRGVVSGLLNLSRNLGLIVGASMMGSIFAMNGNAASGMRATFALAALLIVAAAGLAIFVGRARWAGSPPRHAVTSSRS
ncbi:MAG: MFS transporter [Massilia sp.]